VHIRLSIRSASEILHWFKQLSRPHLLEVPLRFHSILCAESRVQPTERMCDPKPKFFASISSAELESLRPSGELPQ